MNKIFDIIKKIKLVIIAIFCICYFFVITVFTGYFNIYNLIWIIIGIIFIIIYLLKRKIYLLFNMHRLLKISLLILVITFSLSFITIEILIISNAKTKQSENTIYLIVLGAGLNKDTPSLTLRKRIHTALNYSNNNQTAIIIASGGKGGNEIYSEAEVISKILQENGINNNRIIIEDKSRNTYENLKYSGNFVDNFDKKIVIVSSEFHLFRAKYIARKMGYKNIGTLASKTPSILLLNYYIREYFAIIKELLVGNI